MMVSSLAFTESGKTYLVLWSAPLPLVLSSKSILIILMSSTNNTGNTRSVFKYTRETGRRTNRLKLDNIHHVVANTHVTEPALVAGLVVALDFVAPRLLKIFFACGGLCICYKRHPRKTPTSPKVSLSVITNTLRYIFFQTTGPGRYRPEQR